MLLPIGIYRKEQIRAMAREIGLQVADKRDSQEICFVASGDHAAFVRRRRLEKGAKEPDLAGQIVTSDGTVVGQHEGIEAYTIGQRRGLGVALGQPRYVVRIEADSRRVVIGGREELARASFTAARSNWLIDEPKEPFRCSVQIRYNSPAALATVTPQEGERFDVTLDEPRFGIAPGQAAACYLGDRLLGGGWIE
jgi:tRNA-specific 2-thiouridylase